MAESVRFELVTPARQLFAGEADMVVVPGGAGDFGILPGHSPLLSTVRPGTVDVYEGKTISASFFVGGGFAEVTGERCAVLAEEAERVSEITREAAEERLAKAREGLETAEQGQETATARHELLVAEAMLAVVEARQ